MSILNVGHLSHDFGDRAVFHDVSFHLSKGEHIGFIEVNGKGRSISVNIITDRLVPNEGKMEWVKSVRVGHPDQHTALEKEITVRDVLKSAFAFFFEMEEQMGHICGNMGSVSEEEMNAMVEELGTIQDLLMVHDFYIIDSKVEEVGRALGLNGVGMDKSVIELSGGQRTKMLLGKLLLQKPDIPLLGEPVNYLDTVHIEWLKRYLQEYENTFILTSHDVPFLSSVVNLVYHVGNQSPGCYVGDYNKFQEVYAAKKAQLKAVYKRQQQEISELEDFVARSKARVATENMAMSRRKKLDKMDMIEPAREKSKPEFHLLNTCAADKYIFETTDLIIGYDGSLSRLLNLVVGRGQKIVLVGANSIGKTTLLKSILGTTPALNGSVELGDYPSISYFEQEVAPGNVSTCLEETWKEFPPCIQYQVRSTFVKCGLTTKHIESQVCVLNGGGQAKVGLCKLINRESNVPLLDEPADHPDVDAKEELKRALKEYKGSILFIYHEPEFYEGLATGVQDCREWVLRLS